MIQTSNNNNSCQHVTKYFCAMTGSGSARLGVSFDVKIVVRLTTFLLRLWQSVWSFVKKVTAFFEPERSGEDNGQYKKRARMWLSGLLKSQVIPLYTTFDPRTFNGGESLIELLIETK